MEFYICVYIVDTSKANAHPCKPKKVMCRSEASKTESNNTNKLENKWYSFRQTSSQFIFTYPKFFSARIYYAIRDYWINSIKIDQMPTRKIYLFLLPSDCCCRCYFPVLNEQIKREQYNLTKSTITKCRR